MEDLEDKEGNGAFKGCSIGLPNFIDLRNEVVQLNKNQQVILENLGVHGKQMSVLPEHLTHLKTLPDILISLNEMKSKLIDVATGRRQIPLSSHILDMLIMGALLILLLADRKYVKLPGITIGTEPEIRQQNRSKSEENVEKKLESLITPESFKFFDTRQDRRIDRV